MATMAGMADGQDAADGPGPTPGRKAVRAGLAVALALAAAVVAAPAVAQQAPAMDQGVQDQVVMTHAPGFRTYSYEPSVVLDGQTYHLYWCTGSTGDHIAHGQSTSPAGPYATRRAGGSPRFRTRYANLFDTALAPSGSPLAFDGQHTCDPAVIKGADGSTYLYYTGLSGPGGTAAIGVAVSSDGGATFRRANGGKPIVVPAKTKANPGPGFVYGAGQPGIAYAAPYYYLSFTDTTAQASGDNGSGQYALRSQSPLFDANVEELTASGWAARAAGVHTGEYSFLDAFAIDLGYDTVTGSIIAAMSGPPRGVSTIYALSPIDFSIETSATLQIGWREGVGLLTNADRTMVARPDCATLPITVYAAAGASDDPFTWTAIAMSSGTMDMTGVCLSLAQAGSNQQGAQ